MVPIWVKFSGDVLKRSWVIMSQTNKQTNKQMKQQSNIANLPKFLLIILLLFFIDI